MNTNNFREVSDTLSEILEEEVTVDQVSRLTDKQRRFIAHLVHQWKIGSDTALDTIKDIIK
jgi:hypothetical protein